MKYGAARKNIRTGDALFFSGGNWRSWYGIQVMLVRMFKPSKWSHVGMAWAEHGRVFIIEAVGAEVRLFPLSREIPFGLVPRPQPLSEEALDWAFQRLGNKYPQKWKMVLNKLFGLGVDMEGRMDCSDLFLAILRQDGEVLPCAADPSSISDCVMAKWGSMMLVEADDA